jgi:SAM-dependent methyltransferase
MRERRCMLAAMKQCWPAPERNKEPILEVLQRVLPRAGTVLEIASGSGQHAAFFAALLPELTFQPSDVSVENLASITAYQQEKNLPNLRAPLNLDVCASDWGVGTVQAVFCANMIHIAPWSACKGLVGGSARHLAAGGVLVLYGPFRIGMAHTSDSNAAFDERLKSQNESWGVRDLEAVVALCEQASLTFVERVAMPANNQMLVFTR